MTGISIIIPAYNEAARIGATMSHARTYAESSGHSQCEIIVVDDGSDDDTVEHVRRFDPGQFMTVQLLSNPENHGKGYSVRRGVLAARGQTILMCDADMNTPIEHVQRLEPWLHEGFDLVIGSRAMPDSTIEPVRPLWRRLASATFHTIRRRILLPEIRDTQCGFKLFTREAARRIFTAQTTAGYAFDCEVLVLADRMGYRIKEVGVHWISRPQSRVSVVRDGFNMLGELLAIRRRMQRPLPAQAKPDQR